MPAGAVFFTEATGVLQIDENYPVLCLRYMGSATVVNRHPASLNFASFIAKTVDITVTAEDPQFFLQGAGRFGVLAITNSGNQWTFRVIGYDDAPTFNYFIFDRPISSPAGAGLEVRNAQGAVVFSSLYRTMVVSGFTTGGQTSQLTSGRSYAYGFGSRITLQEYSEVFTDQTTYTYWTYRLKTASTMPQPGTTAIFGTVYEDAIAGGADQGGQSPSYPTGDLGGWGADSTLTVIDVTDLVGAPGQVTAPVVSVSTTFRSVTGSGGTTTTDAVTCSASGGAGAPYAFQWDKVGGDPAIVFFGASNAAAMRTQWANQPAGTSAQAQYRCRVTDAAGNVAYSQTVTFEHNQQAVSATLSPFALPDLSLFTNEPSGYSNDGSFVAAGITQPVVLRFSRGNQFDDYTGGGVFTRRLYIYRLPAGSSTWVENFIGAGANNTIDLTVNNGDTILFRTFYDTTAGKGATSFTVWIYNRSTGGNQIGTFGVTGIIDADNNFNVGDFTLDPLNLTDQAINTAEYYGAVGVARTLSGINRTITIRAAASNVSGNISAGGLYLQKNGANQGNGHLWTDGVGYREATFVNGDQLALYIDAQTFSGAKAGQFYTTLTNMTTGESLGGFWTVCNVDTDNNYNNADYVPDGISLPTLTVNTNENYAANSTGQDIRYLTGFNQEITLRLDMVGVSGSVSGGYVRLIRYTPALGYYEAGLINLETGGSCSSVFLPGDQVYTDLVSVYTAAGRRDMNFTLQLFNVTGGNYLMTQHAVNITVDADNNYNVVGPPSLGADTPYVSKNEFAQSGQFVSVSSDAGAVNITVSGGSGALTYQWVKISGSASWSVTGTTQPLFSVTGTTTFQEYAVFRLTVTDALGRASAPLDVEVYLGAGDQA